MALHGRQAGAMLLVLLTSYLAVRTSPGGASVSEWWLASGIGACAMVISPRRHVPVLGGTVGFLSDEGEGSTFWVDLPIAVGVPAR